MSKNIRKEEAIDRELVTDLLIAVSPNPQPGNKVQLPEESVVTHASPQPRPPHCTSHPTKKLIPIVSSP